MLLDTSGLLGVLDAGDASHERASALFEDSRLLVTHSYVLAELIPLAHTRGVSREDALEFVQHLAEDSSIKVHWVEQSLHRSAMLLLMKRTDKTYSLCDAVSFVIMRSLGITDALTTDGHFEQEGLVRLLKR